MSDLPDLSRVVRHGTVRAQREHDHTVKVDVEGLAPSSTYYYAFTAGHRRSAVGRTKTAAAGSSRHLRLGVVSCASWPSGWFNAYGHLAEQDVDVVVHLGDYYYEKATLGRDVLRAHDPPTAAVSLQDYRARHAQYRSDPDLLRLHQQHPMAAVWDDHEFAGDASRDGAAGHDPALHGDWVQRRDAAARAYAEWMPIRLPDPAEPLRIYRALRFGDLADLLLLDTRIIGRDRPLHGGAKPVARLDSADRALLGPPQREWLYSHLVQSAARWRLLANQVMLTPLHGIRVPQWLQRLASYPLPAGGAFVNPGQWDGYPQERGALFDLVRRHGITDVVVLTGDIHSSWAGELTLAPATETPVGVEFVTPSVTAPSFASNVFPSFPGAVPLLTRVVAAQNRQFRYVETEAHGYTLVDVRPERVQTDWWHVATIKRRSGRARCVASWQVHHGHPHLKPAAKAAPARRDRPQPAPPAPGWVPARG